jgi:outer membrane protein OmpU
VLNKIVYLRDPHPSEPIIFNSDKIYTKRILLTTTSLVLAAGVAQADVSFSGTAGVALIDDNGASDATRVDMFFESYYDFDITASAESDNGVSVSVGFDMGAGNKIDYNDDDELEAQGNSIDDADVAVSYAGWTLTVDQNGIDNLFDDDQADDVMISGTIAGWSVAMTSDQEASTSSYKIGGNVAGVALTLTGTDNDDNGGDATKIAASYAMGNGLTLTASVEDESLASGGEDEQTVGFSYAMDALTVGYTAIKPGEVAGADAFGDEWDLSLKYSAGAMVASFAIDEADATTIIADYALGGGASAFAAMHDKAGTAEDLTAVGLNFAF